MEASTFILVSAVAAFVGGIATYSNNKANIKLGARITDPDAGEREREKENTQLLYRAEHAEYALELELAAHKKLRRTLLQKAPEVLKAIDAEEEERKRQELEDGD